MRSTALLLLFAVCSGCASSANQLPAPSRRAQSQKGQPLREEFDPRLVQKDLLLIQPVFPRPNLNAPAPVPAAAPAADTLAAGSGPPPLTRRAYQVQLMALSREDVAQQHRAELEASLGVPVHVEPEGRLFVVRAGDYPTREEAEALKERLVDRRADYADAYVVALEQRVDESGEAEIPVETTPVQAPDPPTPAVVLVPAFGWRVLIDQDLVHARAEDLKQEAMRRLQRTDIDVTFKAPWYKVEMGNFRTETEAQEWVETIKNRGYRNALKVRAQILVPQE